MQNRRTAARLAMVKNKAKPNDHDDADNEDEEVAQVGSKENAGKKGKMKDKGKKREGKLIV